MVADCALLPMVLERVCPGPALLEPPLADPGVVAGQQDLRNSPAAVIGRACVVRDTRARPRAPRRTTPRPPSRSGRAHLAACAEARRRGPSPAAPLPPGRSDRSRSRRWRNGRARADRSPRSGRTAAVRAARRRARRPAPRRADARVGVSAITRRWLAKLDRVAARSGRAAPPRRRRPAAPSRRHRRTGCRRPGRRSAGCGRGS